MQNVGTPEAQKTPREVLVDAWRVAGVTDKQSEAALTVFDRWVRSPGQVRAIAEAAYATEDVALRVLTAMVFLAGVAT